jgi:Malic enzyme, NAD binding domain/Fumarase C C-terminus
LRRTHEGPAKKEDQSVLFLGAGLASTGIGGMIVEGIMLEGLSEGEAQARISMFDINGLLESSRKDILDFQKPYTHKQTPTKDFVAAIEAIKPTAIIGVHNVLESAQLRAEGIRSFNARCAPGIEPNAKRIKEHLDNSLMLVTALNPHIGYEKAAQISLLAYREDISLKDAALKLGFSDGRAIRPMGAARGHDPSSGIIVAAGRRESLSLLEMEEARSALLPRAPGERGPAGGAEVATVVRHAGRDPLNVRNILVAEPHRVRFAGCALFRRPLLLRGRGRRRECEREPEERCEPDDRSQSALCGAKSHYQASFGCLWRYF